MSVLIMLISICALQMLIFMQFFEKPRNIYLKTAGKFVRNFMKFATILAVFFVGAVHVFSRFEPIIFYLITNAEELLTPERIETIKNFALTYLSLTLDLSPTGLLFLSFMSLAYYAAFMIPGAIALYQMQAPLDAEEPRPDASKYDRSPPERVFSRGKIFLELCQLRN